MGICCPPASEAQRVALTKEIVKDLGCEPAEAKKLAAYILKHFDLAPVGSLSAFKAEIARLARLG